MSIKYLFTLCFLIFCFVFLTGSMACFAQNQSSQTYDRLDNMPYADPAEDDSFEELWDAQGNVLGQEGDTISQVQDPFEIWNRACFQFNDRMFFWVLQPLAQGYSVVCPQKVRSWVANFFTNLLYPVRFANCLFQGKFSKAGYETSKFIANICIGCGGLGDITQGHTILVDISKDNEDLGQTLGLWGIDSGAYLVLPFFGPSSIRDTIGMAGDTFLTPTYYVTQWHESLALKNYEKINALSLRMGSYEDIKEAALDPYIALRSAYLRLRVAQMDR